MFSTKYLIATFLCYAVSALKLPDYITSCKKSDPNFDACALEKTVKAYEHVVTGDKTFKSPPLDPFTVPLIEVDAGPNLALKFKNLKVIGLGTVLFDSVKFDLTNKKATFQIQVKNLTFDGEYDVSGRILVLPITGTGDALITFVDGSYTYVCNYDLKKNDEGEEYVKLGDFKLDMKLKRADFRLDNLFNGDKTLGDNMNKVLNENWEQVLQEIGVGVSHTIATVVTEIFRNYFEKIPYSEIFPE